MAARAATPAKTPSTPPKKIVVRKPRAAKVTYDPNAVELVADDYGQQNAYIPDESVWKSYIGRKVFGGSVWDFTAAEEAMADDVNMLLDGDTGSGKTLFGEAFASKIRALYYSIPCDVGIDPSSLTGKMVTTEKEKVFAWQDGPLAELVRASAAGHKCVINISEVNMMPPRIAAVTYPLLDHRRYIALMGHKGEIIRAGKGNLLIIGDMNGQYRGTMELNAAFRNRWPMNIPWGYSDEVEEKLIKFPTLRDLAARLRALSGTEISTPVSTNLLMEFERFAMNNKLGLDFAISNFVARFTSIEQQPVERVVGLMRSKLEGDMKFLNNPKGQIVADDDLEELEFEFEAEEV